MYTVCCVSECLCINTLHTSKQPLAPRHREPSWLHGGLSYSLTRLILHSAHLSGLHFPCFVPLSILQHLPLLCSSASNASRPATANRTRWERYIYLHLQPSLLLWNLSSVLWQRKNGRWFNYCAPYISCRVPPPGNIVMQLKVIWRLRRLAALGHHFKRIA